MSYDYLGTVHLNEVRGLYIGGSPAFPRAGYWRSVLEAATGLAKLREICVSIADPPDLRPDDRPHSSRDHLRDSLRYLPDGAGISRALGEIVGHHHPDRSPVVEDAARGPSADSDGDTDICPFPDEDAGPRNIVWIDHDYWASLPEGRGSTGGSADAKADDDA